MTSPGNQIAIVTDDPGWHGRVLRQALSKHGLNSRYVSLIDARLQINSKSLPVKLPGFSDKLPLGVFVRGVPGGTLEQVILRLDILHMLVEMGVPVFNHPRAIERTVDKAMTSFLLKQAGLPTPMTWVCESKQQAQAIYEAEHRAGHELVLKPLFGSQGIGVQKLNQDPMAMDDDVTQGVFYLQRFIQRQEGEWQDIRVFVIEGKARAAMLRRSKTWITNRAQGGSCEYLPLDAAISRLAEDATRACDIDYAGIDLIMDKSGRYHVLEVNSVPAWWGLQKVCQLDIATLLIDSFVNKIHQSRPEVYHQ